MIAQSDAHSQPSGKFTLSGGNDGAPLASLQTTPAPEADEVGDFPPLLSISDDNDDDDDDEEEEEEDDVLSMPSPS